MPPGAVFTNFVAHCGSAFKVRISNGLCNAIHIGSSPKILSMQAYKLALKGGNNVEQGDVMTSSSNSRRFINVLGSRKVPKIFNKIRKKDEENDIRGACVCVCLYGK